MAAGNAAAGVSCQSTVCQQQPGTLIGAALLILLLVVLLLLRVAVFFKHMRQLGHHP